MPELGIKLEEVIFRPLPLPCYFQIFPQRPRDGPFLPLQFSSDCPLEFPLGQKHPHQTFPDWQGL